MNVAVGSNEDDVVVAIVVVRSDFVHGDVPVRKRTAAVVVAVGWSVHIASSASDYRQSLDDDDEQRRQRRPHDVGDGGHCSSRSGLSLDCETFDGQQ